MASCEYHILVHTRLLQAIDLTLIVGCRYGAVAATLSSIMVMLKAPHAEYNAKLDVLRT